MVNRREDPVDIAEYLSMADVYFHSSDLEAHFKNHPEYIVEECFKFYLHPNGSDETKTLVQTILYRNGGPVLVSEFKSQDLGHTHEEDESPNQRQWKTYLLMEDVIAQALLDSHHPVIHSAA